MEEDDGKEVNLTEVANLLYEVGHSLDLIAVSLEHSEEHLRNIRDKEVDRIVKPELKLAA